MFEVKTQGRFSAAHNLRDYQGDCENLHGHNWLVEVCIAGERDDNGIVLDFRILKKALKSVLASLDHKYLNDLDFFKERNTTTENIAEYVFKKVAAELPENVKVSHISAWESPGNGVTYRPDL